MNLTFQSAQPLHSFCHSHSNTPFFYPPFSPQTLMLLLQTFIILPSPPPTHPSSYPLPHQTTPPFISTFPNKPPSHPFFFQTPLPDIPSSVPFPFQVPLFLFLSSSKHYPIPSPPHPSSYPSFFLSNTIPSASFSRQHNLLCEPCSLLTFSLTCIPRHPPPPPHLCT